MIFWTAEPDRDSGRDPLPSWKSERHLDRVVELPGRPLARIALGGPCGGGHLPDAVCLRCVGRVQAAVGAAREVLLARVCPDPRETPDSEPHPEFAALLSPQGTNFAMKLAHGRRLVAKRAFPEAVEPGSPVSLLRHTVSCKVSDSDYVREVRVSVSAGLLKALADARFSVRLDGECVVDIPLSEAVSAPGVRIPPPDRDASLFHAVELRDRLAVPGSYLGIMAVHGTLVEVLLDGVPDRTPEGGITTEVPIARYTTKGVDEPHLTEVAGGKDGP